MENVLVTVIVLFSLVEFGLSLTAIELKVSPSNGPVWIGDQVNLTCIPQNLTSREQPVLFAKPAGKHVSEKCLSFESTKYPLTCEPPKWLQALVFRLSILSVSWEDRGNWNCKCSINSTVAYLEVYAMGRLKPLTTELLVASESTVEPNVIQQGHSMVYLPSEVTGKKNSKTQRFYPIPMQGIGTIDSPINLKPNAANSLLKVTCHVSCSYPPTHLRWTASNKTSEISLSNYTSLVKKKETCTTNETTGMSYTEEVMYINCSTMGLEGLTEITCEAFGKQYEQRHRINFPLRRSVVIACPVGLKGANKSASPSPFTLTKGEVVAIGVGCGLALLLLCLACCVAKQHRKDAKEDQDYEGSVLVAGVHV